jgi:hypothetical protein
MKIYVTITDAEVPVVPGSITHAVEFDPDVIDAHRLLQLGRDTGEAVALAFIRHPPDWSEAKERRWVGIRTPPTEKHVPECTCFACSQNTVR